MNVEEDETIRWNSPSQFQLQEQPSRWSRFIDKYFVRLKTTYWNRGYAIVLLGLIGIIISWTLFVLYPYTVLVYLKEQNKNKMYTSNYNCSSYKVNGYFIGLIPGGVLATVYPAHKVLGVSVFLFSIGHIILLVSIKYLSANMHCFTQFYTSMAMATINLSIHGTLAYSIPLKRQSVRHVPVILCWMIFNGGHLSSPILHEKNCIYYTTTLLFGVVGLLWYLFWLYAIDGNRRPSLNPRYSSNLEEIPWKSFFNSKPLLAIALLYACDAQLNQTIGSVYRNNEISESRKCTIILLLLFIILAELVPEIVVSIPAVMVRKLWSCSYFSTMGIYYFMKAILGYSLRINKIWCSVLKEMQYLYIFGFYLNHLDIAPKYASLLYSLLLTINYISNFLWDNVVNSLFSTWVRNEVETGFMMGTICFAVAVFYDIFASAEVQPWAVDNPDILEFIENSPHGVILFTLGSVVNMSRSPDYILNPLKEALAQVPQRILWKYEGEMVNKPKNVMIRKWLPQREILLHPNLKLFISHGGMSGVYETVDAGVPVLGFPLFYDQPRNITNLVNAGMAISMDILSVKKDTFLRNV